MKWRRIRSILRAAFLAAALTLAVRPASGQAWNTRVVGQIGGGCRPVRIAGNYAYIGEGPNLRILDVTNPASPIPRGRIRLPEVVSDLYVSGNIVYVANIWYGLQIIDVTTRTQPVLRGTFRTPGAATAVFVSGTLAYVADLVGGLQIINISNPAQPTRRGSFQTAGAATGVWVAGNRAYVIDLLGGLEILDVTNPAAPTLLGAYHTPGTATAIYVSGTLAYVTDQVGTLQIIDVSDPAMPWLRGFYDTSGAAVGVFVSGNKAYVNDAKALRILDVSDPGQPALLGSYEALEDPLGICVSGTLAYVTDWPFGLKIINVANPTLPTLRGFYRAAGEISKVSVSGNLACVGNRNNVEFIDIANPTQPTFCSAYATTRDVTGVFASGNLAYVTDHDYLYILDATNPWQPRLRGLYGENHPNLGDELNGVTDIFVSGNFAYVTEDDGDLYILDISNPSRPTRRGYYYAWDLTGFAALYVSGNLAYIVGDGLEIVDVGNPALPAFRGSRGHLDLPTDVFVSGNLACVTDMKGLHLIDVRDPANPSLLGSLDTPGEARSVYVVSGLAYVAWDYTGYGTRRGGVQIIDISDPSHPRARGSFDTPGWGLDVSLARGLAYVAASEGGMYCLQFIGNSPRIQSATISDVNNNGVIERGDQLVLTLDRSAIVTTSALQASHFFLAVAGDSLGTTGFRVGVNSFNSRQIILTLGQGAHLTPAGAFSMANRAAGSPSGIDFSAYLPIGSITSLDGFPAIDGGQAGVNDSGIDVELSLVGQGRGIGPTGGSVSVVNSPNAAYKQHRLTVPARAIPTTTTFTLRPPTQNLGVIDAVQVQSSNPTLRFASPATVRVEYRTGDIDRERGQRERNVRVHQLVENPRGVFRYLPVLGAQTLNMAVRQVSVNVTTLNPRGSVGGTTVFAGLPIETVDERTISVRPKHPASGSGIRRGSAPAVLDAGTTGIYTLHRIIFPNYETASDTDTERLIIKIRFTELAERTSLCNGQSFPAQSDAIFTVTAKNASGADVAFDGPVNLRVQFKQSDDPTSTDVVLFDGRVGSPHSMRLVHNRLHDKISAGQVDFVPTTAPVQAVNVSQGTVTINNVVGLTGPDGRGTFGVVATQITPAARWELYR